MLVHPLDKFLNNVFADYATTDLTDFVYNADKIDYYQTSTDNEVIIEIPLAGVSKEETKITIENGMLTVESKPNKKSKWIKTGKKSWAFDETLIDTSKVIAKMENGLLTITLPRSKPVKKTVEILVS